MVDLKAAPKYYRSKLAEKRVQIEKQICVLEQEGRQDEANLEKVRLNILNVFDTVAIADERAVSAMQGDAWLQFSERYRKRFRTLSQPWRARLEQARLHRDTNVIAVEEAKLEMAEWIEKVFENVEREI